MRVYRLLLAKLPFISRGLLWVLLSAIPARADVPVYSVTLKEAEHRGIDTSNALKASESTKDAAESLADASHAPLFPKLTLDATYYYLTQIPELNIGQLVGNPNAPQYNFGAHSNYNVGPTLTYTVFDAGVITKNWKSNRDFARAREQDVRSNEKQLLLNTRSAYFRVQLGIANLYFTTNSLKLSQAQYRDIRNRFEAGASSRLDEVTSHREVLNNQLRFRQVQSDLAISLHDLFALTQTGAGLDVSRPVTPEIASSQPEGTESPTLVVRLDELTKTLTALEATPYRAPDASYPQIRSLQFSSDASRLASEAQSSSLWPKVQILIHSAAIYPNGPIVENTYQNTFQVTASLPLFEADQTRNVASQKMKESLSAEYQRDQRLIDLTRDWSKARDQIENLSSQKVVSEQNVQEAVEASRLTYKSYLAGKVSYLDVQNANNRLLEAEVTLAQINVSILNEIANLAYLTP